MIDRTSLLTALDAITAARREAQGDADTARALMLSSAEIPATQELAQTQLALVRQLDNAARELADAVRTCDQRDRLAAKV